MHDFVSHILRRYFEATAWNEYNSYLHLTSSSAAVLDFPVPTGVSLSISASPTPPFFTTYRLGALPNLRAGIGYIYASTYTPIHFGKSSKDVKLKHIIERFRIVEAPRRPCAPTRKHEAQYYWLAGERFAEPLATTLENEARDAGEYLVYGCMHVPSARLDALWTKRMSPTWQLIVTAVSTPPKYPLSALHSAALATQSAYSSSAAAAKGAALAGSVDRLDSSTQTLSSSSSSSANASNSAATQQSTSAAAASYGLGPPGSTNLQLTLQRDTGRWFTEYSYSVDDALWGFRVLHNFGTPVDSAPSHAADSNAASADSGSGANATQGGVAKSRIDAASATLGGGEMDTDAGGGLRGRFSAGAEVFVSMVEKSAGLSTGIRFSTLPDTPQPIIPPFDPTQSTPRPACDSNAPSQCAPSQCAPSQPPTVITATLNPMMGHLSTAYAARMARDVVVCSRFDFNVYSYDSEWTVGAEYWLRSAAQHTHALGVRSSSVSQHDEERGENKAEHVRAVVVPVGALSLRESSSTLVEAQAETDASGWSLRPPTASAIDTPSTLETLVSPITGVLKARISTTSDIRLLWQGRLSNCVVSLGVKADLSSTHARTASVWPNHSTPANMGIVKSIGVQVMYFSQAQAQAECVDD